jgi:hypothetical protein
MQDNRKDNRYQNRNILVKAYRWLRYKPLYALLAVYNIIKYGLKLKTEDSCFTSRRNYAGFIWDCYMGAAEMKMQYYYTCEEVFGELDGDLDNV